MDYVRLDDLLDVGVRALVCQQEESVGEARDGARVVGQLRHGVDTSGNYGDSEDRHQATSVTGDDVTNEVRGVIIIILPDSYDEDAHCPQEDKYPDAAALQPGQPPQALLNDCPKYEI